VPTHSEDAELLGVASLVVCYGKFVNADKKITNELPNGWTQFAPTNCLQIP